ncbi:MAG: glycoside hydrolase [Cytophagales bacterium]|nr:glycoside hydrolase [Cytophagales bacterium]
MRFLKVILVLVPLFGFTQLPAQSIDQSNYQELKYRMIGPFRASRTVGGEGIPSQPNVFFVGVNNGGVWKTDDFGRTWNPIFDDAPTGSVGDLAVSPVNPDIIYVGTGEGLHRPDLGVGDGIFKSTNGGKTWNHIGLSDVQQVGRLIIHPTNPDIVFVAGLGHPYGANKERGVFRTTNGGQSWEKVLYIDQNTGAIQVEFDPNDPNILFADMWEHREGPWENARFSGDNSGLYKSVDGGSTWKQLTEGLPTADDGLGRIGVGIAPSNSKIMYATVDASRNGGIYRSKDAGESWSLIHEDYRLWGRGGDFAEIKVHPKDPNKLYVGNIASYTSDDGGKSWMSIKGAPGGDDYHRIWINPEQPDIMLFVTDQGATVTVNAGKTWSSWYNQPTSQLYHVTTDNQFPYWVYGGQQESGAIGIASRGNGGQISFREFIGVGADEYGYVAPDPKDPNIIYGGRVMKFDKRTGQSQNVAPEAVRSGKYRILRTMPLLFHPSDPNMLLFATNVLWKSLNGGDSWEIISPDLTYEQPEVPASIGGFATPQMKTMKRRGVIYAVAASPLDVNIIWAGTDDGRVHLTVDGGKTWKEVTPKAVKSWDKISIIDAGHFDENTACIAVNAIRKDDMRPHIYRTTDGGKTWKRIVNGLPDNGPVNVVKEDPKQDGLLFAGTERQVYFSVDAGENWQSLRQNMPASSIRDLVIKDNDLVVGTHGRSIWILDNISPLRGLSAAGEQATLYPVAEAYRVRWNMFSDTPLPPEEPTGENPPDGAIIDFYLSKAAIKVRLDILDASNQVIRSYASTDQAESIDTTKLPHPTYWIRPFEPLHTSKGHHRFVWDLRHEPPNGTNRQFAIAAVWKKTPSGPHGPFVVPGTYKVRLTVDGNAYTQDLAVKLDPRVAASEADIKLQGLYSKRCYDGYNALQEMREDLEERIAAGGRTSALQALRGRGNPGEQDLLYGSIYHRDPQEETIVGLQGKFIYLMNLLQGADVKPTSQTMEGVKQLEKSVEVLKERWKKVVK